jgi:pyruvate formate lyase activating enzyme
MTVLSGKTEVLQQAAGREASKNDHPPSAVRGLVFDIQRFSVHDGPGIRTTVFLKGCPLRCAWCHNPESHVARPELMVLESRCIHCGTCREVCPERIKHGGEKAVCVVCGTCVEACPTGARQIAGREIGVDDLVRELRRDRIFYDDSGGGVTFSGGEPLSQFDFLRAALIAARAEGFHTAVDTCGYGSKERLLEIAGHTDLFLYDLKLWDSEAHYRYTGVPNTGILENLRALGSVHPAIWIRIPVIPGVNDDLTNMDQTARFVATIPGVRQVNLLPFHRTGIQKFARLGRPFSFPDLEPPSREALAVLAKTFVERGVDTRIGG